MHYYQFNIGDYHSHTSHLDALEDLAYRRMIDQIYLSETPLPNDIEKIARLIRMRSHTESIATVLEEFFKLGDDGYYQNRIAKEIARFHEKSDSAKRSAEARWGGNKGPKLGNANAKRTQSGSNANHKPRTTKHKPVVKRFKPPSLDEVIAYCNERANTIDAERFIDYYTGNGWIRGKTPIKDWKACVRTWEKNEKDRIIPDGKRSTRDTSLHDDLTDTSWADKSLSLPSSPHNHDPQK